MRQRDLPARVHLGINCKPHPAEGGVRSDFCKRRNLLAHVHLGSDFGREVFLLLLDAFALDEVNGIDEGDLAAELLGCVGDVALNGALEQVGADELLLKQAGVLEEGVE